METEILKILIERTSYLNIYWNFYIVVATAIAGIVASGKIELTKNIRLLLTITFLLFAGSNLYSILSVNDQRQALVALIDNSDKFQNVVKTFTPKDCYEYILFHLLMDIAVLFGIWRINVENE